MQQNSYHYKKPIVQIEIEKMPIWFKETEFNGEPSKGTIKFQDQNMYDEIWGSNVKIDLTWQKKDRNTYFQGREVQESINMYNSINVVVTEKQQGWMRSHEFTYWLGDRTKMIQKRYYPENYICGVFFCEQSERLFTIVASVIRKHYEGYKPYILELFNSIVCH